MTRKPTKAEIEKAKEELEVAKLEVKLHERILASKKLEEYVKQTMPTFIFEWYHHEILKKLDEVVAGKIKKLMIFLHPRIGKSTLVSMRLPAFYLGKFPDRRVICASYNQTLAEGFGRKTRNIVISPEHRAIFPNFRIADDKSTAGDWETSKEGGYLSRGVISGIVGKGFNLGIIDDPIKPLASDTPIPTPSGWKQMGDLKVGDKVFDHAGRIINIVGMTPKYKAKRHRVHFSDGSFVDAHPDHLWMAFSRRDHDVYTNSFKDYKEDWWKWKTRGKSSVQQVNTVEISQSLIARKTMRNWTIPNAMPLQLPEADLPIDPYIFGYWLGDGSSRDCTFTVQEGDSKSLLNYVKKAGYFVLTDRIKKNIGGFKSNVSIHTISVSTIPVRGNKWGDSLSGRLRKLGVRNNKHIPKIYLRAGYNQRLQLLRGLMDSDGTTEYKFGEATFVNTNKKIADGVRELIVSLGGKVVMTKKIPKVQWGDNNKMVYILRGFFPFQVFGLPRKAKSYNENGQIRRVNRTIVDVEVLEETEHLCITVDSESHLFLAGKSMIPTCNSRQDAESETYRLNLWDWYMDDFHSRRDPANNAIILMHQRWHPHDLAGRLIEEEGLVEDGGEWELLNYPAIDEAREKDGHKYLSNKRGFGAEFYEHNKKILPVRTFASHYQQDPIEASGRGFSLADFRYFALSDVEPKDFTFAVHVDPAFSSRPESDDTAVMVIARHKTTGELYVLDVYSYTMIPTEAYNYIFSLIEKWKSAGWTMDYISIEDVSLNVNQQLFIKGFNDKMKKERKFYTMLSFRPAGKGIKVDRIKFSLEPMFSTNSLYFRNDEKENTAWRKMEEQILQFPACKRFDVIDALAQGVIMWNEREQTNFEDEKKEFKEAMDDSEDLFEDL